MYVSVCVMEWTCWLSWPWLITKSRMCSLLTTSRMCSLLTMVDMQVMMTVELGLAVAQVASAQERMGCVLVKTLYSRDTVVKTL